MEYKGPIISNICSKKLPLSRDHLSICKFFCEKNQNIGVLEDRLPEILYKDWTNRALPAKLRGRRHIKISSEEWRRELENVANKTLESFMWSIKGKESMRICAILMWRGALAYALCLARDNIKMYHLQTRREKDLTIKRDMCLSEKDKQEIQKYDIILIPDPILASGSSACFVINFLASLGVCEWKIVLLNVCASPEGVYYLLNCYRYIKIITFALGGKLNKNADIISTGLGDAGSKYLSGNSIENFQYLAHLLRIEQWRHLEKLVAANQ